MPDHPRQRIRHAAVRILTDEVPALGGRVFRSRVYPMVATAIPGACVYTLSETGEEQTVQHTLLRRLSLAIDLYARDIDAPDDELDALALGVETAMNADRTLAGTAKRHFLAETAIGFDGQGEKANAIARLRYQVIYVTAG